MSQIKLYGYPGSCAKVPMIILEEISLPYELELVRLMKGEQKSAGFRMINPKGKVPTMVIDGESVTENPAIITFLNALYPSAGLLPPAHNELERTRQFADLCFCSATLHPIVSRIRAPHYFVSSGAMRDVWERGCAAMDEYFQLVNDRLKRTDWWYGGKWSAMDAYLYWVFWRVSGAGYDSARFPAYSKHAQRMENRQSVIKARDREIGMERQLTSEGLSFELPSMLDLKPQS